MDFDTSETLRHPARALKSARDLAALTGQRVWFVRQIGHWTTRDLTHELYFRGSSRSIILEWRVGPLVRAADPRSNGQPRLLPVSSTEAAHDWRLFNIDWTAAHLRRRRVQMIFLASYLSPNIRGPFARYGASAVFANEADARGHQALLRLVEENHPPYLGDQSWLCEVSTETLPTDFYQSLSNRPV